MNEQLSPELLSLFAAVRARHHLTVGQLARVAGISESYLGNATRYPDHQDRLKMSTVFRSRLTAALQALDAAQTHDDIEALLNAPAAKGAPRKAPLDEPVAAPSDQPSEKQPEGAQQGEGELIGAFVDQMRSRGRVLASVTLTFTSCQTSPIS